MKSRNAMYVLTLFAATVASASVIEFTEKAEWESAVGSFTTLDFIIPPSGTPLSDQYAHLGVNLEGFIWSHNADTELYHDGWGMRSAVGGGGAWVHFDTPQHWVAVDYPGSIRFELFLEGESVYLSSNFQVPGPSGTGGFAGLLATMPFDMVHLHRVDPPPNDSIAIDDLHFGTFVPAPGALGLLGLSALAFSRRRRR